MKDFQITIIVSIVLLTSCLDVKISSPVVVEISKYPPLNKYINKNVILNKSLDIVEIEEVYADTPFNNYFQATLLEEILRGNKIKYRISNEEKIFIKVFFVIKIETPIYSSFIPGVHVINYSKIIVIFEYKKSLSEKIVCLYDCDLLTSDPFYGFITPFPWEDAKMPLRFVGDDGSKYGKIL